MQFIKNVFEWVINNEVAMLILAAPVFIIANVVGGIFVAKEEPDRFNWYVLRTSLRRYLGILLTGGLIFLGACMVQDGIELSTGFDLPLKEIVLLGIVLTASAYAADATMKYATLTGIKLKLQSLNKKPEYPEMETQEEENGKQ